ncbi:MAG TPA: phosphopantetheine-binding protein [Polyangiaceae bacterium]|jgi:acyl carrier protein
MSDELLLELKELIVKELDVRDRQPSEIDDDAPLFGEGLGLDSLDALQLAMAVEEQFGVPIPEGDNGKAVFASVSALAAHVARARKSG